VPNRSNANVNNEPQVLLIAQLRAHLVNGESFELLPIQHQQDVKSEVESLVQSWSESGFLVRGRFIYPWHQVRHVEVTQVEEIPMELAHQRYPEFYGAARAHAQDDFWRTRSKTEKKESQEANAGGAH
jgi:hypothetical protein